MIAADFPDDLWDFITPAVIACCRKYSDYVDADDVRSELVLHYLRDTEAVDRLLDPPDTIGVDEETGEAWRDTARIKAAHRRLESRLARAAERYARKEKAAQAGYRTSDENFYQTASVEAVLPIALTHGRDPSLMPTLNDVKVTTKRLLNESNNLPAMCADISGAVSRLPPDQRDAIWMHYGNSMPIAAIAECENVSRQAIEGRVKRGIAGIVRLLGGLSPYPDESIGSRRVLSNGQARAMTDRQ